jgi:hypothetical protein
MIWQIIRMNLGGAGGRGSDEMHEYLVKWWRLLKDNVPDVKEVRLFRHVAGANEWHYQVWIGYDGIAGWEAAGAMMGHFPWSTADPRYPPIRSKIDQADHQDEMVEELPLE